MAIASTLKIAVAPKPVTLSQTRGSRLVTRAAVRDLGSINIEEVNTFTTIRSSCAKKSTHQWLGKKYEECVELLERPAKVKGFKEVRERMWKGKKYTVGVKPVLDDLDSEELSKTKKIFRQWKGKTYVTTNAAWEPKYVSPKYIVEADSDRLP